MIKNYFRFIILSIMNFHALYKKACKSKIDKYISWIQYKVLMIWQFRTRWTAFEQWPFTLNSVISPCEFDQVRGLESNCYFVLNSKMWSGFVVHGSLIQNSVSLTFCCSKQVFTCLYVLNVKTKIIDYLEMATFRDPVGKENSKVSSLHTLV